MNKAYQQGRKDIIEEIEKVETIIEIDGEYYCAFRLKDKYKIEKDC